MRTSEPHELLDHLRRLARRSGMGCLLSLAISTSACDRAPLDVLRTRSEAGAPDASTDAARPLETACDGLDNDGNGLVDDVDLAADGICDCLSIATVGSPLYPNDDTFAAWLREQSGDLVSLGNDTLTPEVLAPLDVLIVQDLRVRAYTSDEIAALEAWVGAGGGLFTLTGYIIDENTNVNSLLAPFGIQYGNVLVMVNPFANVSVPVDSWHPHPVTRGISKVGVVSAYQVLGDSPALAIGTDVLRGPVTLMRATEYASGRVLAWGDEWITYDSEWTERPDYQVLKLWQNALEWLGPQDSCQVLSY